MNCLCSKLLKNTLFKLCIFSFQVCIIYKCLLSIFFVHDYEYFCIVWNLNSAVTLFVGNCKFSLVNSMYEAFQKLTEICRLQHEVLLITFRQEF